MAGRRQVVLASIARKARLAVALTLWWASQVPGGRLRRWLRALARRVDPQGVVPFLDLVTHGTVGGQIAEAEVLAAELQAASPARAGPDYEDLLFALLVARIDAKRHPRAHLAQRFAAHMLAAKPGASVSQLGQDLFVTFALGERRDSGYFVEFGATDGVHFSNTYRLERDLGWTGIVAEPNPTLHEALRRNRRCAVSDACVWSSSGARLRFSVLDEEPVLSTLEAFQASDFHDRSAARSIEVTTLTLLDLLKAHGAPRHIDYVSIDTEGSELAILEAFDFSAFDVSVFTIEHNFTENRPALRHLLQRHGYVRLLEEFSLWDDWYVKAEVAQRLDAQPGGA